MDESRPNISIDFQAIPAHSGGLFAVREECSHCPPSPIYLGSSIHFSCGLEVSYFRFVDGNCDTSLNCIDIVFSRGYGVTMSACCCVYILLPWTRPAVLPLTNLKVSGYSYRPDKIVRILHTGTWRERHSVVVAIPCDLSKRRRGAGDIKGEDKDHNNIIESDLKLEW